jgi:hypothetical protein
VIHIIYVVIAGLLFQLLTSGVLPEELTADFSIAQICALPLALYLLMKIRFRSRGVPGVLLLLALTGALAGLSYGYTYAIYNTHETLLTRFQDDPLEAKTRRFRKMLNQHLRRERTPLAGRYYSSIENHQQVEVELQNDPDIHAVVWGNTGWVQISINESAFRKEQPLASPIWSNFLPDYKLVNYVPATGLSVEPQPATIDYLTDVFGALNESFTTSVQLAPGVRASRASWLKSAGGLESTWTSYAHRSFPLFLLGNQHLREAFRQDQEDLGELSCALWTYSIAEKYLKRGDNPELQAALFNNKAVALMALKAMKPKGKADKKARLYLRAALQMAGVQSPFGSVSRAWVVAHQNWQIALSESRGAGKKRARKKQRKGLQNDPHRKKKIGKKADRLSPSKKKRSSKKNKKARQGKKRRQGAPPHKGAVSPT